MNALADVSVPKILIKIRELNVPILNDIGHRDSCFGEITEVGYDANIRNINKNKENSGYMMEKSSTCSNNINEMVLLASAIDSFSNNTCNIKHVALSGQVSIVMHHYLGSARFFTWVTPFCSVVTMLQCLVRDTI